MTVQERRPSPPDGYQPTDAWDEAFDADGEPRALYAELLEALARTDLDALAHAVTAHAADEGATFGSGGAFPIDPIPRLIEAGDWEELEVGLGQTVPRGQGQDYLGRLVGRQDDRRRRRRT